MGGRLMIRFRIICLFVLLVGFNPNQSSAQNVAKHNKADLDNVLKCLEKNKKHLASCTYSIETADSVGSGICINAKGLVITVAHVLPVSEETVTIISSVGKKHKAKVLSRDVKRDMALLLIDGEAGEGESWPHVCPSGSPNTEAGQYAFILGHTMGYDSKRGVATRVGKLTHSEGAEIYSSVALYPGDSGGPLFNSKGELIALNSRVRDKDGAGIHIAVDAFFNEWGNKLSPCHNKK